MTCEEFERVLPEDARSVEQDSHLRSCDSCSGLVADLTEISQQARFLRGIDEPNARVWNSIEIALRQEGLIREIKAQPFLVPRQSRSWRLTWPVASVMAIVLIFALVQRERIHENPVAENVESASVAPMSGSADDQQLLAVVSQRSPAMLASYQANLRNVNSYIQDAEDAVKRDPNDEQAQQYLMNAYEQRSMVYEMALDRSLP